jgi:hypothetical protein
MQESRMNDPRNIREGGDGARTAHSAAESPMNDLGNDSVEPHAAKLTVWDVPPATVAGERFKFAVGARCSGGCDLGGRKLSIFDHEGSLAGTVQLGHDVWPGTEALYVAEVEVKAPLEAGSHQWEAKIGGWDAELPHAPGSFPLIVRIVTAPDCEVTVRAVDRETQMPIKGAHVVMHPYRAVTDDKGIARVRVARGEYDILVSASQHMAACASVDVTADIITSAELDADQPWTPPDEDLE